MKFLIICVSTLVAVCSAGNLYTTDLSSLQSILALRSDIVNTQLSQHWPNDYASFTTSVQAPISASLLPHDESSVKLNQHWQNEQLGTYLPQISAQQWTNQQLPQVSSQQWTNQQISPQVSSQQWANQQILPQVSAQQLSLPSNPSTISSVPQYMSGLYTKLYQMWPSEQIHTPLVSLAHSSVTSTPVLHQHEDVSAKFAHHWPTEQSHTPYVSYAPAHATFLTQPITVEKQIPIIVPVPVDRVHTVVKHVPVYMHKKQHDNYWPSTPSAHFEVKRHKTHFNPVSNTGGIFIKKRTQF